MTPEQQKAIERKNLWNEDFFYQESLFRSPNIGIQGELVGRIVGCTAVSYVTAYFAVWKGLKSVGQMVYFTALLPYITILILLIKGLTLPGCGGGLYYLFVADFTPISKTITWKEAATQILFSSRVGYGPYLYYGSARAKKEKLVFPSVWIPLINSLTSMYCAVCMFSFLGHVAYAKDLPITEVAKSGLTLLFVAFPALLNLLAGANFFSVMFFVMCVTLGIDSLFGFMDYYIKFFEDTWPWLKHKIGKPWEVLIITIFTFIWSLMFCVQGGMWNFNLFDANCTHIQLLTTFFLESILVSWVYGQHKFSELIFIRTGDRIPKVLVCVMRTFVPVFAFIMLVFAW